MFDFVREVDLAAGSRIYIALDDGRRASRRFEGAKSFIELLALLVRMIGGIDSAEKPEECFDRLSMNGKISNDFDHSSVRPEALEG